ncbi:MAG TPA: Ig-like domain-containing protein [Acidobacteriaceae bacterium]
MILRRSASLFSSLLALPIILSLAGCSSLKTISILPGAGTEVLTAVGQTAQFSAYGASQMGSAQPTTANITNSVAWSVTNPAVASINSNGVATALSAGYTQVIANSGGIVATSDLTVTLPGSGSGGTFTPTLNVTPTSGTDTFTGETTQFIATGNLTGTGGSQNLTTQVTWISSNVQVATINASGLATAIGGGTTTIIAQSGGTTATATLTVATNVAASTPTLVLIPSSGATATFTGETTQFIALGNLSGGVATQNLTNSVTWSSSDTAVATIDQTGLATAVAANQSQVSTTITAIGTTGTGSLIVATATLAVLPAGGIVTLPTLAVYEAGAGTGTVTSSPVPIVCGSSAPGATCTGNFQLNSTVTLTAKPTGTSTFGGWSGNCAVVVGNPLACNIRMTNNETVGAIFNP